MLKAVEAETPCSYLTPLRRFPLFFVVV